MAKITSRPTEVDTNVKNLQGILEIASLGQLGTDEDARVQLAEDMDGLLHQTDLLFTALLETMETIGLDLMNTGEQLLQTALELDIAQDALSNIIGNIDYDEALDHAAADLMDCMCASGAADVTADGELEFDQRVTFTKEDIKPWLREAIVRWVELKMGQ